jgi:predicted RNA-binding protein with PUA-like domain
MKSQTNYWLIKSEGDCYSIDDLKRDKKTTWEGVRNYQARNFMQAMKSGDGILFYHSSSKPTGVYGLAKVSGAPHADESQFRKGEYYDPKATREKPIWYCVDVAFVKKFKEPISLDAIKFDPTFEGMMVRQQGSRLSVQPVSEKHFKEIVKRWGK